jgi:hypothetical protein
LRLPLNEAVGRIDIIDGTETQVQKRAEHENFQMSFEAFELFGHTLNYKAIIKDWSIKLLRTFT